MESGYYYYQGRLAYENRYYGWSQGVCGSDVTTETANVVCNIICGTVDGRYYGSIQRASRHYSDNYPSKYSVAYLGCVGTEKAIQDCPQTLDYYNNYDCRVKEKVGIYCFKEQDSSQSIISYS